MSGYREVFAPQPGQEPDRIFYTITQGDVGRSVIATTAGPILLGSIIGRVLKRDVGRRLYRVPCKDPRAGWIWRCESDRQRDKRVTS